MDWGAAIDKNREALKRVLAMLIAMAEVGLRGQFFCFPQKGGDASRLAPAEKSKLSPTLPRHLHRAVLRLLRPAEAAARRLVIVAARGLVLPPPRPRQPAAARKPVRAGMRPKNPRPLPLLDRLSPWRVRAWRAARGGVPRISVPGYSEPFPIHLASADDPIDASRLSARFAALAAALDDLPAHAKRFARWRAMHMARPRPAVSPPLTPPHKGEGDPVASFPSAGLGGLFATPQNPPPPCGEGSGVGVPRLRSSHMPPAKTPSRSSRVWPLRPGWPPGWRRKPSHEVHEILDVVHGLAFWVLEKPDTS